MSSRLLRRMVVEGLRRSGDLPSAGKHWIRRSPGRSFAAFHPDAPPGISACDVCERVVVRAEGRWWES